MLCISESIDDISRVCNLFQKLRVLLKHKLNYCPNMQDPTVTFYIPILLWGL